MIQLDHTNRLTSHSRPLCDLDVKGAGLLGSFCVVFFLALLVLPASSFALDRQQVKDIPHADQQARDNFLEYIYADHNKAFAIEPGGTWAWSTQENTGDAAKRLALQHCQTRSQQSCVLYAVNDEVVFDRQAWPQLWRLDKQHASSLTSSGIARGVHFPDLVFKDPIGKRHQLTDFRDQAVLVHFRGSWCPSCVREMPSLLQLQQALKERHDNSIKIILLQVREPFSRSRKWAKQQDYAHLPLYDSGIQSDQDSQLYTANGKALQDRTLARAFPTSYVLDRKGHVIFIYTGPVNNWLEHLVFFLRYHRA